MLSTSLPRVFPGKGRTYQFHGHGQSLQALHYIVMHVSAFILEDLELDRYYMNGVISTRGPCCMYMRSCTAAHAHALRSVLC